MKRVLLVYPTKGWAHHNMMSGIAKYSKDVECIPAYAEDVKVTSGTAGNRAFGHLDVAFHCSVSAVSQLAGLVRAERYATMLGSCGVLYNAHNPDDWRSRIAGPERNRAVIGNYARHADSVLATTPLIHSAIQSVHANAWYTPAGVDCELFKPSKGEREKEDRLVVGWCGYVGGNESVKGWAEIMAPLLAPGSEMETWTDVGTPFMRVAQALEGIIWDRITVYDHTKARPHGSMPSMSEGTPLPVIEAAACGLPVVSTDVGIVSDWPEIHDLGLVVPPYHDESTRNTTLAALVTILERLKADALFRHTCGKRLRESVLERFSWEVLAPRWVEAMLGDPPRVESPEEPEVPVYLLPPREPGGAWYCGPSNEMKGHGFRKKNDV
jgi:glycosyltransferase involved in cell wall biosynthesis